MILLKQLLRELSYHSAIYGDEFIKYSRIAKKTALTADKAFDAASDFMDYLKKHKQTGNADKFKAWLKKYRKKYK